MKKISVNTIIRFNVYIGLVFMAGCAMGPDYVKPKMDIPQAFKETKEWKFATPQDGVARGNWWEVFHDAELNGYIDKLNQANYNLKVAESHYHQALAQVDISDAAYYPTIGAGISAVRSKPASNVSNSLNYTPNYNTAYRVSVTGTWVPDFWGAVKRSVESSKAAADSSYASLEVAKLSTQSLFVQNYLNLRALDIQKKVLEDTVANDQKILDLTIVAYKNGTVSRADLISAENQVELPNVQVINLGIQRAQLEHAMAILVGKAPADFEVKYNARYSFNQLPSIPVSLPSTLLERRPDIAVAERNVAQANASIGIAEAAFFPNLSLAPTIGYQSVNFSNLLDTPSRFWSIGPSLTGTVFNGGLFKAQKAQAIANYDQAVAQYKQTVLSAFQQVEDNLVALNTLKDESHLQDSIVQKSDEALALTVQQFKAGTVSYLNVLTAENALLSTQLSMLSIKSAQYNSLVSLVVAMGGSWI